jgi:hypothetical protein
MAEANEEVGDKLATIPVEENDNPELQVQPGTGPQPIATRPEAEASLPEKLNDNDEDPKTLWERFIGLFPCFTRFEDMRRVYANDRAANIVYRYSVSRTRWLPRLPPLSPSGQHHQDLSLQRHHIFTN